VDANKANRREVIKALGTVPIVASIGTGLFATGSARPADSSGTTTARIGLIGVGNRGTSLLKTLLTLENVTVPAVADIDDGHIARAAALIKERFGTAPALYQDGPEDFRRLVARTDLDAVIIACPFDWHTPMAVAAMKAGKFVGVEVPAAQTIEECWELVRTSESTGMWCMMLENVCYFREMMQVLNMVRHGLLGELLHCAGGYQHDCRAIQFDKDGNFPLTLANESEPGGGGFGGGSTQLWSTWYDWKRDGNLYPTHPVGPIAQCLNIDRGDRFDYLVSVSSKARGLNKWVTDHFGADHVNAKRKFALGDVNTTTIKSVNGATVTLVLDMQSPRPYDLGLRIQGTQGIYDMPREPAPWKIGGNDLTLPSIYIEGRSPEDKWEPLEKYRPEFEHPLWRKLGKQAEAGGHGGADYIELYRFVQSILTHTVPEQDVYDAATWSVITALSEKSVAARGAPVEFPDFTRGKWKSRTPVPIIGA
jgi:Oxidoreductase family, NAD-binding Rossmann fold